MSVLINGMEMPKSCAFCRFYGAYCYAKGDENAHSTLPCPLIPVPPHGDLIDRDALKEEMWRRLCTSKEGWLLPEENAIAVEILKAPAIIPAEGKDTNVPTRDEGE